MRSPLQGFRTIGWLAAVAVLVVTIVLAFQFVRQTPGALGTSIPSAESRAYPAPTGLPATPLPQGYPAATPWPTVSAAESTAFWATEYAAETANAPVIPTPIGVVIGPQTFQDSAGQFQLDLLPGWRAWSIGTTSIKNYDDESLGGEGSFPPGGLKIQIEVDELVPGQSFEQWLSELIATVKSFYQDSGLPMPSFTEPQPHVLGRHNGVSYSISAQSLVTHIILPVSDGRLIIIELRPGDSTALPEALSMLSTLVVLPEKTH